MIWGRRVTGHPIEYDCKDGTGLIQTGTWTSGRPSFRWNTSCATQSVPMGNTTAMWDDERP